MLYLYSDFCNLQVAGKIDREIPTPKHTCSLDNHDAQGKQTELSLIAIPPFCISFSSILLLWHQGVNYIQQWTLFQMKALTAGI